MITLNDPLRKITLFTFVGIDDSSSTEDTTSSDTTSVQVFDLFTRTDLRKLWPKLFENADLQNDSLMRNTNQIKSSLFRIVFF